MPDRLKCRKSKLFQNQSVFFNFITWIKEMVPSHADSIHQRYIINSNVTSVWGTTDTLKGNLRNNQRVLVSVKNSIKIIVFFFLPEVAHTQGWLGGYKVKECVCVTINGLWVLSPIEAWILSTTGDFSTTA